MDLIHIKRGSNSSEGTDEGPLWTVPSFVSRTCVVQQSADEWEATMSRRGSSLAIFVLAVWLPVTAEADCSCEPAGRPCTGEALATAALPGSAPVPGQEVEFMITSCADCGGESNPLPLLLWGLLFSATIAVKRVVCGPDRLIVFRLEQPVAPDTGSIGGTPSSPG
jgi:hypothetical protein